MFESRLSPLLVAEADEYVFCGVLAAAKAEESSATCLRAAISASLAVAASSRLLMAISSFSTLPSCRQGYAQRAAAKREEGAGGIEPMHDGAVLGAFILARPSAHV